MQSRATAGSSRPAAALTLSPESFPRIIRRMFNRGCFLRQVVLTCRLALVVAATSLMSSAQAAQTDSPPSGAAILQDLRGFREMGSVLFIAAHPDDENTQLLTYLA